MAEEEKADDVAIAWEQGRATNLENWEERVPIHERDYGLEEYRADPDHLSPVVRHDLAALAPFLPDGTVAGLDLCHLQCHIGTDTLSFARAGARVTGVDFSPSALATAARLADELGLRATWVESDVLEAASAVEGWFDVVYTSIGTITWLADLDRWAAQIAGLLRPGGVFYFRDAHPTLLTIDPDADGLVVRDRYFANGLAQRWESEFTYTGDTRMQSARTYEWPHPVSEIVNALLGAGLHVVRLDEGRTLPWRYSPRMVDVGDGQWAWPGDEPDLIPCTLTVVARAAG